MGFAAAVLSDSLLEPLELGSYVWPTATQTKTTHRAYALFIQAFSYRCSMHGVINLADRGLVIAAQVNVRHNQKHPCALSLPSA